jgi:3-methyladenine DNA glycosylase/8-oxoguanine DNA glycosylase
VTAGGSATHAAAVDPARRQTRRSARRGTRAQRVEQAPRAERRPLAVRRGPDGSRAFPDPEDLASLGPDDVKRHGFSSTKARTIIETARAIVADELDLEALQRLEAGAAIERLTRLRGIGRWTAE